MTTPASTTARRSLDGMTGATRLAERAVLAAIVTRPERLAQYFDPWLTPHVFADTRYGAILATVAELDRRGELTPVSEHEARYRDQRSPRTTESIARNAIALVRALESLRVTDHPDSGWREVVHDIVSAAPDGATASQYVRYGHMVLRSATSRRLDDWGLAFTQVAPAADGDRAVQESVDVLAGFLGDVVEMRQREMYRRDLVASGPGADLSLPDRIRGAAPLPAMVQRAERDVLAAVLHDPDRNLTDLVEHLQPEDFTQSPAVANTWRVVKNLASRGDPVDPIIVAWELEGLPADRGPVLSTDDLTGLRAPHSPLSWQVSAVARASLHQRMQRSGAALRAAAQDPAADALAVAEHAASELHRHAGLIAGDEAATKTASRITVGLDGDEPTPVRPVVPTPDGPTRGR